MWNNPIQADPDNYKHKKDDDYQPISENDNDNNNNNNKGKKASKKGMSNNNNNNNNSNNNNRSPQRWHYQAYLDRLQDPFQNLNPEQTNWMRCILASASFSYLYWILTGITHPSGLFQYQVPRLFIISFSYSYLPILSSTLPLDRIILWISS